MVARPITDPMPNRRLAISERDAGKSKKRDCFMKPKFQGRRYFAIWSEHIKTPKSFSGPPCSVGPI